jgi:hypothetical protein
MLNAPARISLGLTSASDDDAAKIEVINRLLAVVNSLISDLTAPFTVVDTPIN